jgi:hypothetical protein
MKDECESVSFYRRVLPGYEGEEIISQYLASVTDEIAEMLGHEEYKSSPRGLN